MSENRKHERFSINQAIEYSLGREEFIAARGINISEGGLLFETDHMIETMTQLYFLINVPLYDGPHPMEVEGVIRHSKKVKKGYRSGVEFFGLGNDDKKILKKYIKEISL